MKKRLESFLRTIFYCLQFTWESSKVYFSLRLLLVILSALIPYISLYVSKCFIDILLNSIGINNGNSTRLILLLAAITCLAILLKVLSQFSKYIQSVQDETLQGYIAQKLMQKGFRVDIAYFDAPDYLDTMQAVNIDSMSLSNIIWNIFYGISSLISLIIAFIMLLEYSLIYTMVIIVASIPMAIANQKYSKVLYRWRLEHMNDERKKSYLQGIAQDRNFAADIRLYGIDNYFLLRYRTLWEQTFKEKKRIQKKQLIISVISTVLPEICTFSFLAILTMQILNGQNTVGDYTLYSGLYASLTIAVINIVHSFTNIYEDRLKVDTIQNFEANENAIHDDGSVNLNEFSEFEIEFRDVYFSYPHSDLKVLNGISFHISDKEKICLLGMNGAGKSTIIKLLLRFYEVDKGTILINKRNIKDYTITSLRRCISTFFQENMMYAFTIAENIRISDINKIDEGDNSLNKALNTSGASTILKKLPKKLNTHIGRIFDKDGYSPSGGEAQKIALARALYRQNSFIIFDEPSASLDPEAENQFYEKMEHLWENKTALFTSHRLSAVHIADRIILINDGIVSEQGTHDELMKINGKYAYLYRLQASKYFTDPITTLD